MSGTQDRAFWDGASQSGAGHGDPAGNAPSALLTWLARLFNDRVMGLLALVALATALGPEVFKVSARVEHMLTFVEWVIVGVFVTDFFIEGVVAEDRRAWIRSPWRIVDVLTVLGPVVALIPQVTELASGSLMFRMLRVGRAVAFGTRAGSFAVRKRSGPGPLKPMGTPVVSTISPAGDLHSVESDWRSFLAWPLQPSASWLHAFNLDDHHFRELAHAAGASDQDLDRLLGGDCHAKLYTGARFQILVLKIPTVAEHGFPEVHRDRLLAVINDRGILTAMTGSFDLQKSVREIWPSIPDPLPFPVRITCALLSLVRERNLLAAQRFDAEAGRMGDLEGGNVFLQETFRLRREISVAALDLWHVKGIVHLLADGKAKLAGYDLKDEQYLGNLLTETESLHETVSKDREELKGLIELHINLKSFQMNSFLKMLAVVSCLGLIPTVVSGLLGMNVVGTQFATLGQVVFSVAMGMATVLYVFAVKGWLR